MMGVTSGFFSRDDHRLPDIFKDSEQYVYFIEDIVTKKWLSKNISLMEWTNDPLKALSFKNYYKASTFANENKLYGIEITEHEFFPPPL